MSLAPVDVLVSFAPADEALRRELAKHLASLQRAGKIARFDAASVLPGDDQSAALTARLSRARIVLLLVSADFLDSRAAYERELKPALERHAAGQTRVIPVLARACLWSSEPFGGLAALPRNGTPIASWSSVDEALLDVARGVEEAAEAVRSGAGAGNAGTGSASVVDALPGEVRALEEKLTAARRRRDRLAKLGKDATALRALDDEILDLRRKLRERGQLAPGDTLGSGRYVLEERIGRGGFATVWKAHDEREGREVAIKVLHGQFATDEQRRERFFRGARVMAGLSHRAIVRVLDPAGHDRGFDYFVMELVRGGTLRDAVLQGRLMGDRIGHVIVEVGEALSVAHTAGHIHRDVKPANILLDEEGNPKLTDFDLVGGAHTTGGTRTGAMGTFVYAAPEAMERPQDAGPPADVYGLGMTAMFCHHGAELPAKVIRDAGKVIRALACADGVKAVLGRAIEWEVEDRFADVAAFCEALRACVGVRAPETPIKTRASIPAAERSSKAPEPIVIVKSASIPAVNRPSKSPEKRLAWAVEEGEDEFGRFASFRVEDVVHRMRWVPAGKFLMGSPEGEVGRVDNEGPQHEVRMSRGFWLAETPCTQALWQVVMGNNPSRFWSWDRPVENVTWNGCRVFLAKLNERVRGLRVRLPTEAEWEYACRGGTTTATWAGDLDPRGTNNAPILDAIAWYAGNSGHGFELSNGIDSSDWPEKQYPHTRAGTRPVHTKARNPHGLHDMLGNVYEWCADWLGPYSTWRAIDPSGPRVGSGRVVRGGSWSAHAGIVRAANRAALAPQNRGDFVGFRLARS